MARLLVDTDVFIRHLRGGVRIRPKGHDIAYSAITRAELFAGGHENRIRSMLEPFEEISVTRAIAERAGRLRRADGLDLADALIASTALEHKRALVTSNDRDFRRVAKLRLRGEV